jgi:hypothetical protein
VDVGVGVDVGVPVSEVVGWTVTVGVTAGVSVGFIMSVKVGPGVNVKVATDVSAASAVGTCAGVVVIALAADVNVGIAKAGVCVGETLDIRVTMGVDPSGRGGVGRIELGLRKSIGKRNVSTATAKASMPAI